MSSKDTRSVPDEGKPAEKPPTPTNKTSTPDLKPLKIDDPPVVPVVDLWAHEHFARISAPVDKGEDDVKGSK